MEKFTESTHCRSGAHCKACRSDEQFRQSLRQSFEWDGTCPKDIPPGMPSLPSQTVNLAGALARTVKAAVTGKRIMATPDTVAARRAICVACAQYHAEKKRCAKCGCKTSAKLRLAAESCPLGKWTAEK
jgi:ribosomal protein L37E